MVMSDVVMGAVAHNQVLAIAQMTSNNRFERSRAASSMSQGVGG